jgi:beta-lactamase class C
MRHSESRTITIFEKLKRLRNVRAFCLLTLLLGSHPALASESLMAVAGQFEQHFRSLVSDRGYPGAAFTVVTRDEFVHLTTVGHTNAARTRPIDAQTTFRLASVSKTFAAEVVGMLVEEGRLDWDDPVIRYVPEFKIDGDTSKILIHHLLGQSTGLIPHAYDNLLEHGKSLPVIWERMADLPFLCQPGRCYGYQNSVFSLVEPVVERASKIPYEQFVEQRIFKPLDMSTASLGYRAFVGNPNRAEPHARSRDRWKTVTVKPNYYRAAPAAGVNASITDMGKWLQAQLGSQPDVLSPELVGNLVKPRIKTRRELYRKQWKSLLSNAHYGLGWRIYQLGDEQLFYHGGWVSGFRADIAFSLQHNVGIAILLNAESSGISELTTEFWRLVLAL